MEVMEIAIPGRAGTLIRGGCLVRPGHFLECRPPSGLRSRNGSTPALGRETLEGEYRMADEQNAPQRLGWKQVRQLVELLITALPAIAKVIAAVAQLH
jgi:hypothetical protein